MKIHKLHIVAFGGLKDKTIEFSDGFNLIYGDNEDGKTTVMNFIKMMFYGNARGSSQISKNPRKRYAPWDGSPMAGSIEFEHSERSYRLEREFKSSNATDKVVLCDLNFGTRQVVPPDVGAQFFGLSAAAFERSVFLAEPGAMETDTDADGEINARLSNMVTTGDESVSYNTVHARLEKAQLALMSKRKVGEYDKNEKAIAQAEEELKRSEEIYAEHENFKLLAAKASAALLEMAKKAKQLKQRIDGEQDARNAQKMREMLALKEKLDGINHQYTLSDGSVMDESYLTKLAFCLRKTEDCESKLRAKRQEADKLQETIDLALHPSEEISPQNEQALAGEIAELESQLHENRTRSEMILEETKTLEAKREEVYSSKKGVQPVLLIAALFCLVGTVALFLLNQPYVTGYAMLAFWVLLILAFALRPWDQKAILEYQRKEMDLKTETAKLSTEESKISEEISRHNIRLTAVRAALNSNAALIERQKEELALCHNEINELQNTAENERKILFELFARYQTAESIEEIRALLPQLETAAQEQKELKNNLRYLARDLGNPSYEEVRQRLEHLSTEEWDEADFQKCKQEYETLVTDISEKKAALSAAKARAEAQLSGAKQPEILKKEIEERRRIAASQKAFYEAAQLADEMLTDSFALLRKSYGSALEKKAGEIFAGLTGGKYDALQISKAFEIFAQKKEVFGAKESAYLSAGTEDQAYLSLRLALSELIFENTQQMPLLLDDVLSRYDDTRLQTALDYLTDFAKENQILFFTCHHAVEEAARKKGANNLLLAHPTV